MSSHKRELTEKVQQHLKDQYPEADGWSLSGKRDWKGYKIDFVVEKKRDNKRVRNVIKIAFESSISDNEIKHLNSAARRMSGRYVKIGKKIFAVGNGCDTSGLTEDFELIEV